MDLHNASAPRIYFVHPLWIGPLANWNDYFERAAAMGFNCVLSAQPFAPAANGNFHLSADHRRLHPVFQTDADSRDALRELALAAKSHGLDLLLDMALHRVAVEHPVYVKHAPWFHPPRNESAGLDPRFEPHEQVAAWANFADPEACHHLTNWWSRQLLELADAGVSGFRFEAPHRVPAHVWRRLGAAVRERHPAARFLAWTPGLARHDLGTLVDAGFDGVFSSLRWWDYRAGWAIEEHAALAKIAPPIAFPEEPLGTRLAHDLPDPHDDAALERAYRRALYASAALGSGLMIPAGFEFGASDGVSVMHGTPQEFRALRDNARFDLAAEIAHANSLFRDTPALATVGELQTLESTDDGTGAATVLLRGTSADLRQAEQGILVAINADLLHPAAIAPEHFLDGVPGGFTRFKPLGEPPKVAAQALQPFVLAPAEVRVFMASRAAPILTKRPKTSHAADAKAAREALAAPRIAIESVTPAVDEGRFAARRVVGESVGVEADIFADGHDQLAAVVRWRAADMRNWQEAPMHALDNDRWHGTFALERLGRHEFTVLAWRDDYASLLDHMHKKLHAGQQVELEIQEARKLLAEIADNSLQAGVALLEAVLSSLARAQTNAETNDKATLEILFAPQTAAAVAASGYRPFLVEHPVLLGVEAERAAARFASWYEIFPRSMSDDPRRHGTFIDVIGKLPRIRDMGFDVLYFPPIHPIGRKHRKGKNNALAADDDDVGSPYAIGSADGGHEAIHPELGSFDDFKNLLDAAREHGLEIALDFAIQCSPDHPWLAEHPGWFAWRPDGSLRYAENPPKKYQDIVNPDFYAQGAMPALWLALRDAVMFWVERGIKIFRVDNPHTKPLPFWEWMIAEIRGRYPEVIFLAEAFTRPRMMHRLGKVGFSQSYSYFTWRESKQEFIEYLSELTSTATKEYFRPNFFVNTPDINPRFLQRSGRAGFVIRAALAATLSGLWGVYCGFELCEAPPLPGPSATPGEEYLDSEKYQLRAWDWDRPGNITWEIAVLNRIRRANPALHTHLGVTFLSAHNDNILFFEKATARRDNVLLVAINLDPFNAQTAGIELPLWRWNLDDGASLAVTDLVSGDSFAWHGRHQTLYLDPSSRAFAIWHVRPA